MIIEGRVWVFADNIDTDAIIAARYLNTVVPEELAKHLMEDIQPDFPEQMKAGDILVAGSNFGCSSSREHAPLAIKGAGVACVVARSFARIFYRNAINIGLPILECSADLTGLQSSRDQLKIDLEEGLVTNLQSGEAFYATPFPPFMQELIKRGGLIEYVKSRLC